MLTDADWKAFEERQRKLERTRLREQLKREITRLMKGVPEADRLRVADQWMKSGSTDF
jgi:hypothetical protein